jgi:hypothetical protein
MFGLFIGITSLAAASPCPVEMPIPGELDVGAMLGTAVAIDGDVAAVGAMFDTGVAWATGAVYVYRRTGDTWQQEARLIVDDADWGDMLGVSVDILGDTVIAGAWFNDAMGGNSGAAYIFERDGGGNWSFKQKLIDPAGGADDLFGRTVAIESDFCAIGTSLDDDQGMSSGSITVFDRLNDGTFAWSTKLLHPGGGEGDQLGLALATDGDRILGGAPWSDDGRGEVHLWARLGGVWTPVWEMSNSGGNADDYFGFALAIENDRMAVGCYSDDTAAIDAGSIWILEGTPSEWDITQHFAPAAQTGEQFGVSLGLSGDQMLVGSRFGLVDGISAGKVDVFSRSGGGWAATDVMLPTTPASDAEYGWSVAIDNDHALVGAPYQPDRGDVLAFAGLTGPCGCATDLNGDGTTGVDDLLTLLEAWGATDEGDIDGDGNTGIDDLLALIAAWGVC